MKRGSLVQLRPAARPDGVAAEQLSDAGLVAACAAADRSARALLFGRHVDAIHRFVARMRASDPDIVEDLAVRRISFPGLPASRREELAAEVMARSDLADAVRPRRWIAGAAAAACAAAIAVVVASRGETIGGVPELALPVDEPIGEPSHAFAQQLSRPPPGDDTAPRMPRTVKLTDGEVSLDASARDPVTVIAGNTRVIVRARAKVVARGGVIVTAHVFAGTADIDAGGRKLVVEAGEVWTRPDSGESLDAFRTGWEALRARHYAIAIAAFDRATDEIVAEDAAFWAAIASERAGDHEGAARRLQSFLDRFPASPRVAAARSALDRVTGEPR